MVWSEYVEQTNGENDYSDDENDDLIPPRRLTIDDWTAWYSEDLLNMWFSLVQYREDSGRKHAIMKGATYSDFCEFCYNFSHGFAS